VTALFDACVRLRVGKHRKFKLSERISNLHVLKQIHVNSTPMKARLRTMTDKGRLLTDRTIKSRTVVAFASGKGHVE